MRGRVCTYINIQQNYCQRLHFVMSLEIVLLYFSLFRYYISYSAVKIYTLKNNNETLFEL